MVTVAADVTNHFKVFNLSSIEQQYWPEKKGKMARPQTLPQIIFCLVFSYKNSMRATKWYNPF